VAEAGLPLLGGLQVGPFEAFAPLKVDTGCQGGALPPFFPGPGECALQLVQNHLIAGVFSLRAVAVQVPQAEGTVLSGFCGPAGKEGARRQVGRKVTGTGVPLKGVEGDADLAYRRAGTQKIPKVGEKKTICGDNDLKGELGGNIQKSFQVRMQEGLSHKMEI